MPLDLSEDITRYTVRFCPEYPKKRAACVVSPEGLAATVYGPQKGLQADWDAVPQERAESKAGWNPAAFIAAMEWAEGQRGKP